MQLVEMGNVTGFIRVLNTVFPNPLSCHTFGLKQLFADYGYNCLLLCKILKVGFLCSLVMSSFCAGLVSLVNYNLVFHIPHTAFLTQRLS